MRILFTGRKAHLTPALKALAESKLVKLEKYLGVILDSHVILSREKHRHVAEIVVKARARTLAAKGAEVPGGDGAVWQKLGMPSIFEQGTGAGWLGMAWAGAYWGMGGWGQLTPLGWRLIRTDSSPS